MSRFASEMLFVDKRGIDPDRWYACSRGSRVVMLAIDKLKQKLAHAYELLHPDED